MYSSYSFIALSLVAMGTFGCGSIPDEAANTGEVRKIERKINLFFYESEGFSYHLPPKYRLVFANSQLGQLIVFNPSWSASDGLIIEDAFLGIENFWITAHTSTSNRIGNYIYSYHKDYNIPSLRISLNATVHISRNCTRGVKTISVRLPGIPIVAYTLEAKVMAMKGKWGMGATPENWNGYEGDGRFLEPDSLIVARILVL